MLGKVSFNGTENINKENVPVNPKETKTPEMKKNGNKKLATALLGMAAIGAASVYAVKSGKIKSIKAPKNSANIADDTAKKGKEFFKELNTKLNNVQVSAQEDSALIEQTKKIQGDLFDRNNLTSNVVFLESRCNLLGQKRADFLKNEAVKIAEERGSANDSEAIGKIIEELKEGLKSLI